MLNCAVRPSSRSSVSFATFAAKISSVTWPPPASSAQWPAFAAAATISGSTVVGVMPASRIGDLPVSRVKAVSTTGLPSPRSISRGAYVDQSAASGTVAPEVKSRSRPFGRGSRDDGDAAAAQGPAGHVGGELGRAEVDDPAGVRADRVGELARPVDGLHADGVGEVLGQAGVETAGLGPVAGHGDGGRESGVVEAEGDRNRLDGRG